MSKIKILPKFLALVTAGATITSVYSYKKDNKELDIETSISVEKDYEVIETKQYLSRELMGLVDSYDGGLKDYIINYTNFSNGYVSYDETEDKCLYFINMSLNQRKVIYDFAYNYYKYLNSYNNNDVFEAKKYIVKMINKSREFGSTNSILLKTFKLDSKYLNNSEPLIPSSDYNDYMSLLNNSNDLSINFFNGDIIDNELSKFILFLNLYAKYNIDPLFVLDGDKIYLANQSDVDIYLKNNNKYYDYDKLLSNFSLSKIGSRWIIKLNNQNYRIINTNSLNFYLNDLSVKYNKDIFSYSDMLEYGIVKMVFCDEKVFGYYNYDKIEDMEEYWWPIGSSDTEIIDGVEFAKGIPEETFENIEHNYICGYNGSGVTNIIASKSGLVIYPTNTNQIYYENDNKYGNYVIIKHFDGNYTLYSHLSFDSITVMNGDYVSQGQVIGKMGKTGNAFDVYLEFEIFEKDLRNKVNINDYISKDEPRKTIDNFIK